MTADKTCRSRKYCNPVSGEQLPLRAILGYGVAAKSWKITWKISCISAWFERVDAVDPDVECVRGALRLTAVVNINKANGVACASKLCCLKSEMVWQPIEVESAVKTSSFQNKKY